MSVRHTRITQGVDLAAGVCAGACGLGTALAALHVGNLLVAAVGAMGLVGGMRLELLSLKRPPVKASARAAAGVSLWPGRRT